jgi:pilus assembly protein Flp/PilA
MFAAFFSDDQGATAIEYGLIATLVGIAIIAAATALGAALNGAFTTAAGAIGG